MVATVERIAGRRQINQMILADPVMIVFNRRDKIETPGGGWKWGAEHGLVPQQIALIPFKRRMTDFLMNTELGELPNLPYTFLGRWNLDVLEKDWFMYGGNKFVVKTIDFKTEIRVTGQIDYFGKAES